VRPQVARYVDSLAELMGSFPVIVPPSPGLLCALGDLVASFRNEFAQTLIRLTAEVGDDELRATLDELEGRAREGMEAERIPDESQHVDFVADMRSRGQGYEIPVPLDDLDGPRIEGPAIVTEFDSTTVVLDGYAAEVDRYFNLLIRPEAPA
jgi:N-methylhydantoinase A/oxoprolinase/acetone carboxylase beta subunit